MPSRLKPSSAATCFGAMKRHQTSLSSRCERRMPISTSSTCAPASSNAATALSTTAMTRAIDREDAVVARIGDLLAGDRGAQRAHEVHLALDRVGVARIVAGEHRHRQGGVLDRAGDRAFEDEGNGAAEGLGPGHQRHAAERGLVAIDAAPGRGDADRAAAVGALAERQQPCRHRAGAAAGGAAGVLRQVEGVLRGAVEVVVAGAAEAEDRAVGLADEDRAGLLHPLDEHAVGVDDIVLAARGCRRRS